ncbi:MAG TPA: rod shape-determining protein MreC [Thermoanaerobaculia bacterium]|nr:rod shape-determining protein MreC [Thermoanaerobaculia bacterium]
MRPANPRVEVIGMRPRRGGMVLASTLVLCVLMLSAQAPARGRRGSVLQAWILTAAAPIASSISAVARAASSAADSVGDVFVARSENVRLKKTLAERDREIFHIRAELSQERRRRSLASAAAILPNVVGTAPVLLMENRAGLQSALIGAGSTAGVVVGSPIAVTLGLVGRVVTVGRTMSRAQLLIDASAAAGARLARTGETGVIRGDGRGGLKLNNIPTTSRVEKGDLVESAGIDGIYPRGVAIGRVSSVSRGSSLFLEIRVLPAAAFSQLTDVLVLAPSPAVTENPGGARSGAQ